MKNPDMVIAEDKYNELRVNGQTSTSFPQSSPPASIPVGASVFVTKTVGFSIPPKFDPNYLKVKIMGKETNPEKGTSLIISMELEA